MKKAYGSHYYAGAFLWLISIQYYIVQLIAAGGWHSPTYSWAHNTISDLGNTACGQYGSRQVCSALHPLMNASFVLLGLTMISGAFLLRRSLSENRLADLGFTAMAISGIGTVLVGLFPENSVSALHITGAALPFILGNLGMIAIGAALKRLPVFLRGYTMLSGIAGLIALPQLLAGTYLGLGIGGMERVVAYPQSIWMIVFGAYLLLCGIKNRPTSTG